MAEGVEVTNLSPLKLLSTEELVKEIESRCDSCVIVYERPSYGGQRSIAFFYHGGVSTCIGHLERFKHDLLMGGKLEDMPEGGGDE